MYKTTAVCVAVAMVAVLMPGVTADPPTSYSYTVGIPIVVEIDAENVVVMPTDQVWTHSVPVQVCADFANGGTTCVTECGHVPPPGTRVHATAATGPIQRIEITVLPFYIDAFSNACAGTTGSIIVDGY